MGKAGKTTIWTFPFVALLCMNFFQAMGSQICMVVIPLYAYSLGATVSVVGIVTGAFAVTALASRPFLGAAFQSFSNKRLLMGAYSLSLVSMLLYSVVSSIPLMVAVRFVHGLGIGCATPLALSIVSNILPQGRLSSGISIYTLGLALAQTVGPIVGIWASGTFGYGAAFLASAGFQTVALVLSGTLKVRAPEEKVPFRVNASNVFAKEALRPALVLMLLAIPFSCTNSFVVLFGQARGIDGVGLYFTVYALCLLLTRPLFGSLSDRFGVLTMLVPSILLFCAGLFVLSRADSLQVLCLAAVLSSCGYGVANPLVQSYSFEGMPASRRGVISNTTYTGVDAGNLIGPYLGGSVVDVLTPVSGGESGAYGWMWLVLIIPVAFSLVLVLAGNRRRKRAD